MAVVAEGKRGRIYLSPTAAHEEVAARADALASVQEARNTFLSGETPTRAMITGGVCSAYGLSTWGHLFTSRQLVALTTFSDLVSEARDQVLKDIAASSDVSSAGARNSGTYTRPWGSAVGASNSPP